MAKENNLTITHPELCKEWDYEKNEKKPENYTYGSNKKVNWILNYTDPDTGKQFVFRWKSSIVNRTMHNIGCPYLSGQAVLENYNDLLTTHPSVAAEWDYEKNYPLTPQQVTAGSSKKVWWILPYDDKKTGKHFDFSWQASISNRCGSKNKNGCPYLMGTSVWPTYNDLATTHPIIAEQWDYEKNYPLTPQQVSAGSHRKVWWLLPYEDKRTGKHFDFSWSACIYSRCKNNRKCDCPYLTGNTVWPTFNDLTTTDKEIAETWHPTLNKQLKPTQVSRGSGLSVWWLCEKGHTYKSKIYNRIIRGCPYCAASSSEKLIHNILNNNDISFEIEKRLFEEIKRNPYDIFLNELNLLVELDGEQHFKEKTFFENRKPFSKRVETDNKKNKCAFENNIPLLRIPYTYFEDELQMEALVMDFIRTRIIPKEIIDFYKDYEFSNYAELAENYNATLRQKAS